mgnify:CR=1 FL=1
MKCFPVSCLCILLLAAFLPAFAEVPASAKAKAALALADCKEPQITSKVVRPACHIDAESAFASAKKNSTPVVIWVGMTCEDEPEIRDALDGAVHCHQATYHGDKTPRILIYHGQSAWEFDKPSLKKQGAEIRHYLEKAPPGSATTSAAATLPPAVAVAPFVSLRANCPNGRCPQR